MLPSAIGAQTIVAKYDQAGGGAGGGDLGTIHNLQVMVMVCFFIVLAFVFGWIH